jgi:electron transfer flavoprotein beta subunit
MAPKVCACLKVVPRSAVAKRLDETTHRLDRSGASELNPHDLYAVEEAVQLRERIGGELIAVTMAPDDSLESLRGALAMGIDRAVAVADPAIAGSDLLATSRVLAAVLGRERPDVIIFGGLSADGGGAQLSAAVGERMGLPVLSGVRSIEVTDGRINGIRQTTDDEVVLESVTPCIVGLGGSTNVPRYPAFRDIVAAKKKAIDRLSLADLGIDPASVGQSGSRTDIISVASPPHRDRGGQVVTDEGQGAAWLFEYLVSRCFA